MPDRVRFTLIAISLFCGVVGAYYRIQSQRSGEPLDRTKEGWPILIGLRLAGVLLMTSTVAWLYDPAWFEPVSLPVPDPARWIGVVLFACAVAWLIWMFHSLGRNLTDTVVTRSNAVFVSRGPYRYVRNPMYTGFLFAGLSFFLASGNLPVAVLTCVLFLFFVIRTRIEERYLIERFGDQYREYMARVGRFLPRL